MQTGLLGEPYPKSPKHRFCINTRIKLIAFKYSEHYFIMKAAVGPTFNPLIKSKSNHTVQNACSVSLCIATENQWSHNSKSRGLYRYYIIWRRHILTDSPAFWTDSIPDSGICIAAQSPTSGLPGAPDKFKEGLRGIVLVCTDWYHAVVTNFPAPLLSIERIPFPNCTW